MNVNRNGEEENVNPTPRDCLNAGRIVATIDASNLSRCHGSQVRNRQRAATPRIRRALLRKVVLLGIPEAALGRRGGSTRTPAELAGARLLVQVDVGMGDAAVPAPTPCEMASLLDLPGPRLQAYARETVVAEKLEALVVLGLATSRMKDLYDLELLRRTFSFDHRLHEAVAATFARRGTPVPAELPVGLSDAFAFDGVKNQQWRAFLRRSGGEKGMELGAVVAALRAWLWPVLQAVAGGQGGAGGVG
jgi:hypothetical protein